MTATRRHCAASILAALVSLIVFASAFLVQRSVFAPWTITAYFSAATAIYPGDQVRVLGVEVGTIDTIEAQGTQTKVTMRISHATTVPADAQAVIVAPNLVAARYIQLTPAYTGSGPTLADGGVIPVERTAVPIEWD